MNPKKPKDYIAIIFAVIGIMQSMPVYACPDHSSDINVIVAIPERGGWSPTYKTGHLSVVIENKSSEPIKLYDAWNSWGYFNITLAWHDFAGHSGTVKPHPVGWDKNFPSTTTLQPGEVMVRDVSPDWDGWPKPSNDTISLVVKAIYESKSDPNAPAWCGKAESKEITLQFW